MSAIAVYRKMSLYSQDEQGHEYLEKYRVLSQRVDIFWGYNKMSLGYSFTGWPICFVTALRTVYLSNAVTEHIGHPVETHTTFFFKKGT